MKKHILITIDLEDWFQVENLRPWFPPSTWNEQQLRIEQNTHRLLDLLDEIQLVDLPGGELESGKLSTNESLYPKATFFILGWVAERIPRIVREIKNRGHEVASHGYGHQLCNQISRDELKEDLVRSKNLLEDITGSAVCGYRAPSFSIDDGTLHAIQSAGYTYDSSYNDFSAHGRYGKISINDHLRFRSGFVVSDNFYELPVSNLKIYGLTIPWGGGGYFRFFPFSIFKKGIKQILKKSDAYVFYLHPWEVDPEQPRMRKTKTINMWRHYLNLDKTLSRMYNLIATFKHHSFVTCKQYLGIFDAEKSRR